MVVVAVVVVAVVVVSLVLVIDDFTLIDRALSPTQMSIMAMKHNCNCTVHYTSTWDCRSRRSF